MSLRVALCCGAPIIILVALSLWVMWELHRDPFKGLEATSDTSIVIYSPPDYEGLDPLEGPL